ncbi:unnamed protein product [Schistosoma curassoni]|uniref:Uncharacterized protein n=1 Tax=Schistosoma curassoni TaxID=6186 RepID=A0A183L448_9TREM|nr:unnamed protein product [Schistosoma curassoni]
MVVGGSQQETRNPGFVLLGTRQQGVLIILRELMLPDRFDPVSPSFTVKDVNILSQHRAPNVESSRVVTKLQPGR